MTISASDFDYLANLLKVRSGLTVGNDKHYLLESRLLPIIRRLKFETFAGLVSALRQKEDAALITEIIEAMTTNETSFFRDTRPFDQFRQVVLPHIIAKSQASKRIRIWSAACSTGQEPYSLAMCVLEESAKLNGITVEIVATDLATHVLKRAEEGLYSQFEVQRGLPITHLVKYFEQRGDKWRIRDNVRSIVKFKPANLLADLSGLGLFDIIYCRNVLIYFDVPTKGQALTAIHGRMQPHSVLCLGSAETLYGIDCPLKAVSMDEKHRGLYVRNDFNGALN